MALKSLTVNFLANTVKLLSGFKQVDKATAAMTDKATEATDTIAAGVDEAVSSISDTAGNGVSAVSGAAADAVNAATSATKRTSTNAIDAIGDIGQAYSEVDPDHLVRSMGLPEGAARRLSDAVSGVGLSYTQLRARAVRELDAIERSAEKLGKQLADVEPDTFLPGSDKEEARIRELVARNTPDDQIDNDLEVAQLSAEAANTKYRELTAELESLRQQAALTLQEIEALNQAIVAEDHAKQRSKAAAQALKDEAARAKAAQKASLTAQKAEAARAMAAQKAAQKRLMATSKAAAKESGAAKSGLGGLMGSLGKIGAVVGGALIGVRTLYAALRKMFTALTTAAMRNSEFAASVASIKGSLSTAFQPIYQAALPALNALAGALARVTNLLAQFVAMLFGSSYSAASDAAKAFDAEAEAIGGAGGAADKAKKSLAAFDEINVLSGNDSGGGGGGSGGLTKTYDEPVAFDTSGIDRIKTAFEQLFGWMKPEAQKTWHTMAESFRTVFDTVAGFAGNVFKVGFNAGAGFGHKYAQQIKQDTLRMWTDINEGTRAALEAWSGLVQMFYGGASDFVRNNSQSLSDALQNTLGAMYAQASTGWVAITTLWNSGMSGINAAVQKHIEPMRETVSGAMNAIWKTVGPILNKLSSSWEATWKNIRRWVDVYAGPIKDAVQECMDMVYTIMEKNGRAVERFWSVWGPTITKYFTGAFDAIFAATGWFVDTCGPLITSFLSALANSFSIVTGLITGDWSRVWKGLTNISTDYVGTIRKVVDGFANGLSNTFSSIGNLWGGMFESLRATGARLGEAWYQDFQNIVNRVKELFNFRFTWPQIKTPRLSVSYSGSGAVAQAAKMLGLPGLPKFNVAWAARGGILDSATLIGAGEAGREAILPLDRNTGWMDDLAGRIFDGDAIGRAIAQGLAQVMGADDGREIHVHVNLGGREMLEAIATEDRAYARQTGRSAFAEA